MAHIHTEEGQHDATVSFFIVRLDTPNPSVLLHMHRKIGKWMMFGGHVELDESPWEAALHEITEETGYAHHQLQVLQPPYRITELDGAKIHPTPVIYSTKEYPAAENTHYHTDATYALITQSEPEGQPDDGESTDIILVDLKQLNAIPDDEIVEAWRQIARAILTYHIYSWNAVDLKEFS